MAYYPQGGYLYPGYPPNYPPPNHDDGTRGQPQGYSSTYYAYPPPIITSDSYANAPPPHLPAHPPPPFGAEGFSPPGASWTPASPASTWCPQYASPILPASTASLIPDPKPRFKNSNKVLLRLGLLGLRTAVLFAFLNLVILLPARQSEIGFSASAKQIFNSAIILISLLIARAVKHFYEECAKAIRWAFLCRAHTYNDTVRLMDIDSTICSGAIIWSYLKGKSRYRRISEIFLILVMLVVATTNELAVALLGFTFQIDDVSYLEMGNVAYMTNWDYIGYTTDVPSQTLTARTNAISFLNKYGTWDNPLDMGGRGLHWTKRRPNEYFYTLLEWDDQGTHTLARPSRWPEIRNMTVFGQCNEEQEVVIVQDEKGCSVAYAGEEGKPISHHIRNFDCNVPDTIFFHDKRECGPRCSRMLVLEALTTLSPYTKLFSCNVTVGQVRGTEEPRALIGDDAAKIFASSLAYGGYQSTSKNATISRSGTIPLNSITTPNFSFQEPQTHPARKLGMTDAQWVAAILARFTMASISSTDGENPRFQGPGKTQITLDRLQCDVELLNAIIGAVGGFIFLTLVATAYLISDLEIPVDKPENIASMIASVSGNSEIKLEKRKPTIKYVSGVGLRYLNI